MKMLFFSDCRRNRYPYWKNTEKSHALQRTGWHPLCFLCDKPRSPRSDHCHDSLMPLPLSVTSWPLRLVSVLLGRAMCYKSGVVSPTFVSPSFPRHWRQLSVFLDNHLGSVHVDFRHPTPTPLLAFWQSPIMYPGPFWPGTYKQRLPRPE